jgi:hypothetical protein
LNELEKLGPLLFVGRNFTLYLGKFNTIINKP